MWRFGVARFIPACAGNTRRECACDPPSSVHPRVCGEHTISGANMSRFSGSSPRVRGTPTPGPRRPAGAGFIPACAGNTSRPRPQRGSEPVHPRVCGEHTSRILPVVNSAGSSPRVRGTRSCAAVSASAVGSSPRVRGTRRRPARRRRRERFIPACAGNTSRRSGARSRGSVHPRVCGEHPGLGTIKSMDYGSSPRVRGTHDPPGPGRTGSRFIPACAGNTRSCSGRWRRRAVHPRVCGEHAACLQFCRDVSGSSPRVRGTHTDAQVAGTVGRFIPACAGNTRSARSAR